jgi:putative transposase
MSYKWKVKYGGLDMPEARRLKALADENWGLKKLPTESRGLGVIFP